MNAIPAAGAGRERYLIAVDVDGTLLDSEFEDALRPREVAALRAVRDAGHVVALCTGRNSRSVAGLLARCDPALADLPLVLLNGAVVVGGVPRRRLAHRTLDQATLQRLVALFRAHGALPMVYDTDDRGGVLHHEAGGANSVLARYLDRRRATVGAINVVEDLAAALPDEALEVGTIDREELVLRLTAAIERELGQTVRVVNTESLLSRERYRWAEVYHRDCGKGAGARLLAAAHGIPERCIVALGDNYNDLDLFAVAGHSVAMGNAPAPVRAAADHVAPAVQVGGGAWVLEEIAAGRYPPVPAGEERAR
ncbi:MAG: HAD hydrolase family protein [Candidatus Krumholzibacteriia bacterium]